MGAGVINDRERNKYSLEGKKSWRDNEGKIRQEFHPYLLRKLMSDCADFRNEKSAMAHLFEQLSEKGPCRMILLVSPKYHCEIAGEGIEYAWGLLKKWVRSIFLEDKKGRKSSRKQLKSVLEK